VKVKYGFAENQTIGEIEMIRLFYALLISILMTNPVSADDSSTQVGIYVFGSDISGKTKIGNITSDVDVSFNDVLENLDMGLMAFIDHRRGKWSFIADVFYADISAPTKTVTPSAAVQLDVGIKQLLVEGFVGYRVLEQDYRNAQLGIDLLAGARYNKIEQELEAKAALLGLTFAASRSPDEDWVDGVIALRAQYAHDRGWGASAWADIGEGADSDSYQLMGTVNYRFDNKVNLFGGYRHYNFRNDLSGVEIELDYSGPIVGVSYGF
jgi:hypothetical protein